MINRAAILLKYKEPALRWINETDPSGDPGITEEDVSQERTIYLIHESDGDTPETVNRWIKNNYLALFETELESWYSDPNLWPKKRTLKLFQEWFAVECHTAIVDTVGDTIIDDEL